MMTMDQVARMIAPLQRRVMLMMGRGVVGPVTDNGGLQTMQLTLLEGEVRDDVERVQNYGLSANPLPGSDCIVICAGGNRDHPVIIALDDRRYRPDGGAPGEVTLYTHLAGGAGGHRITLKADQSVEIQALKVVIKAVEKVRIEAPLLEVTGEVKDLCDAGGVPMSAMRAAYNAHTHAGGPTAAPQMVP